MEWIPKFFFMVVIGMICIFFIQDFSYQSFVKEDIENATKNASKSAMRQSINKGDLRVSGEITIDTERFQDFYKTHYTKNQSVANSKQSTIFYMSSSKPAMVALETSGAADSYFTNVFLGTKAGARMTSINKEIIIFEKK